MVCDQCIADEGLSQVLRALDTDESCGFCRRPGRSGLDVESLFQFVLDCLKGEWLDTPQGEVPWDPEEDSWMFVEPRSTVDVLDEVGDPFANREVAELFAESVERDWVPIDPLVAKWHERLAFGWERFAHHVRFEQRYLFLRSRGEHSCDPDSVNPAGMLDEVGRALSRLGPRVFKRLATSEKLWRGRPHAAGLVLRTVEALGSAPIKCTEPQRMSPAGFSVFYGSDDLDTVLAETRSTCDELTVASWSPTRALVYLDLAALDPVPRLFDPVARTERPWLRFLHQFAAEVSARTEDRPEIDYVPTQIFTEFVRRYVVDHRGDCVDAIRFASSRSDGSCWVVFAGPSECGYRSGLPSSPVLLVMNSGSIRTFRRDWRDEV